MNYNISKATAPAMPNLGKGTECIKILLSQVPILGAHISVAKFQYLSIIGRYLW